MRDRMEGGAAFVLEDFTFSSVKPWDSETTFDDKPVKEFKT